MSTSCNVYFRRPSSSVNCVSSIYDNSNAIVEILAHSPTSRHRLRLKHSVALKLFRWPACVKETLHSVCVPDIMRGRLDGKEYVCLSVYLSCALSLNFLISPASPVYIAASVHTTSLSLCHHPFALLPSFSVSPSFPRLWWYPSIESIHAQT